MNTPATFPAIPGFRVTRELAQGGMATVYEGVSDSAGDSVAIKVMAPALGADPSFRRRFLEECQLTKELSHRNIIRIYAFGCIDATYYMVMEHIPGGTLSDRLINGIPENQAVSILIQVNKALGYAHDKNIVHRDVKPSNVLFDRTGTAILSDFGIAKAALTSGNATRSGMIIGTPAYMSPEQSGGQKLDGRSDLYSLGVMFYQMLVGEIPYKAENPIALARKHHDEPIPRLPALLSKFQPTMDRLLAKKPDDRFPNSEALLEALQPYASISPSISQSPTIFRTEIELEIRPEPAGGVQVKDQTPSDRPLPRQTRPAAEPERGNASPPPRLPLIGIAAAAVLGLMIWWWVPQNPATEKIERNGSEAGSTAPATQSPRPAKVGSTGEEIDLALALCNQHRKDCQRAWYEDETVQTVSLAPFALDQTEVTNEAFARFVEATGYATDAEKLGYSTRFEPALFAAIEARGHNWKAPDGPGSSYKERLKHPVTNMSYNDAAAYCRWQAARLPTAAEWEYAARGDSGRIFPWGAEWKPDFAHWQNGEAAGTRATGSIPSGNTPEGIADLVGNVWEWTSTLENGKAVLKGGSWMESNPASLRAAVRRLEDPNIPSLDNGFRCAHDVNQWPK